MAVAATVVRRAWAWRLPLRWYQRLTLTTAFAIWGLITLGGLVRVTDSGTGCGDHWPMCNGHLFPSLEYHELIEWNHRLFAVLGGGLMMVMGAATLLWYRKPRRILALALLAGATYIGQALLGAATVIFHLDQTWVSAHMGNSMLLLAAVVLLALYTRVGPVPFDKAPERKAVRWLAFGTLIWTYIALFTGSAVVGAGADLACPSWPQCSDTSLLPATYDQWINYGHRVSVGLSDVLMLILAVMLWRTRVQGAAWNQRIFKAAHILALTYVAQVFLGAFTVWLGAPAALKGAHLALAAASWAALVLLTALIWIGPSQVEWDSGAVRGRRVRAGRAIGNLVPENVRLYTSLIRPHVIPLLLVPAVAAMLIAAVHHPTERPLWELIFWVVLGGTLATGGAHAINQYFDRDIDALMKRTSKRPVVTGRIPARNALIFGIVLSIIAVIVLALGTNLLAAALGLGGNLFYVLVYTLWLKRSSVQNIVIGGAAGAVPPLVGWAAVTGNIGLPALMFFAIIFFWTPPHFWALALVRAEDYRTAGIPMLPAVRGVAATSASIMRYALLLVGVTVLPFAVQALGPLYLVVALALGAGFLLGAARLIRDTSQARAWKLFKFSNNYLALLYLAMVVDRLLALGGIKL